MSIGSADHSSHQPLARAIVRSHDHTGRSLPCTRNELRIKLENDACRPPLYSQNKRTKLAPNLNPFSRRVSRTHMVTRRESSKRNYYIISESARVIIKATIIISSPQRAHVTFFVKRDKLKLAFWLLCSVHAVIQVPPDGVVGSLNCCCHSFAACTVDVTVCFIRQTVSALTSGLSRYFAQPTPC